MKKIEIEDLLLKFSFREENEQEAQGAFTLFYREYSRYLYVIVAKVKKSYPLFYDDLIDTVVTNTFIKIYESPPLNFEILNSDSDKDVNNKFKSYLATTAKNILFDLLKTNVFKQEHDLKIDNDEISFDPPNIEVCEEVDISTNQRILQEVLLTFKERDRAILLSLYDCHEKGKKRPKEVKKWLAQVHKTTEDNIRQIKSRCDKKIKEHFEKHKKLKLIKN